MNRAEALDDFRAPVVIRVAKRHDVPAWGVLHHRVHAAPCIHVDIAAWPDGQMAGVSQVVREDRRAEPCGHRNSRVAFAGLFGSRGSLGWRSRFGFRRSASRQRTGGGDSQEDQREAVHGMLLLKEEYAMTFCSRGG